VAGLIGDPVRHSLSPVIHNAAFQALDLDWVFLAFEVGDADVRDAVRGARALGVDGLSVTMPHKSAVAAAVDRLTPAAEALRAVNCVSRRGDVFVGDNTDGEGFVDALRADSGVDLAGRCCVVLGAGGAARAVVRAMGRAGAKEVVVVNRTAGKAEEAAALAGTAGRVGAPEDASSAEVVVNATPIGMGNVVAATGERLDLPLDPGLLKPGQLVVDLIYEPAVTPLLAAAREAGAATANGLGMLIHQAAHAFRQWTGEDPPLEAMSAAALAELSRRDDPRN
jgi:shikimate dehydrogenase